MAEPERPDVLAPVKVEISRNAERYGDVLIRAALFRNAAAWCHARTVVAPQLRSARLARPRPPLVYDHFVMLEEVIPLAELELRLEHAVKDKTFRVGDYAVQTDRAFFGHGSATRLPGNTNYSPWPCTLFTAVTWNGSQPLSGALVAHGTSRAFTDVYEGIAEWFAMAQFTADNLRSGEFFLVLPDYRLRIASLTQRADGIEVAIERKPGVGRVQCHLLCTSGGERVERHVLLRGKRMEFALSGDVESLQIFLTGPPNERLDWYEETRYGHSGIRRLRADAPPIVDAGIEVRDGEGPTMEFKPFLDPNDRGGKFQEVVKTVVAFANTHGGVIFAGVDDCGQADNHVHKVAEWARKDGRDPAGARDWYQGWMRSELTKRMNKPAPIEMSWVDIEAVTVLRVAIGEGTDKPYATQDKRVYIRAGATNRQADPDTDLRELYSTKDDVASIMGMLSGHQRGRRR